MKRFFDLTFRPFFVLTGIGIAGAFIYAFLARMGATVRNCEIRSPRGVPILVRHWGIMVGLMGVFMVVAAFRDTWRNPILIYSGVEKAFHRVFGPSELEPALFAGFLEAAAMDAAVVLYTIG